MMLYQDLLLLLTALCSLQYGLSYCCFGSSVSRRGGDIHAISYRYLLPTYYTTLDTPRSNRLSSLPLHAKKKSKAKPPKGKVWRQSVSPPRPRSSFLYASPSSHSISSQIDQPKKDHKESMNSQQEKVNKIQDKTTEYIPNFKLITGQVNNINEEPRAQFRNTATPPRLAIKAPTKARWTDDYGSVTGVFLASLLSLWEFGPWESIFTAFFASYVVSIREVSGVGKIIRDVGALVFDTTQVLAHFLLPSFFEKED